MASASYAALQPVVPKGEAPVRVLVTGFGPFLDKYPKNSSWEIACSLPALIPAGADNPTPIHIHVHHEPVRVSYANVIRVVPELLSSTPPPDVILHMGLAASRTFYAIEQGAHSRGYGKTKDVDGALFPDSEAELCFPKSTYPGTLQTGFDTGDVLARWKACLGSQYAENTADVRTNPDAGNFLCGFIYYNALAHIHGGDPEAHKPVAFMHVPDLSGSEAKLREGREVAVALIQALVRSRRDVGVGCGATGQGGQQEDDARNNTGECSQ